jgi:hypothetical protein
VIPTLSHAQSHVPRAHPTSNTLLIEIWSLKIDVMTFAEYAEDVAAYRMKSLL